jgi:hypothetical protein
VPNLEFPTYYCLTSSEIHVEIEHAQSMKKKNTCRILKKDNFGVYNEVTEGIIREIIIFHPIYKSRGSAFGIANGYVLDDQGVGVRVPVMSRISTSQF